jgi:hypothetical protein
MVLNLLINGKSLRQETWKPHVTTDAQVRRAVARSGAVAPASRERLLYRDALQYLLEKGRINEKEEAAGLEIQRVHAAVVGGGPRLAQARYGEVVALGETTDLPLALMPAHANRYAPWKAWALERRVSCRSGVTLFDLSIAVCFDNLGNDQAAERLGLDRRTVLRRLQASLWQYCLIGGWVSEAA